VSSPAGGEVCELLRIRDFRTLLLSRLVSNLGNGITPIALSFAVLELPGGDGTSLSIVNAAHMIALALFMLAGGVVADRLGRCRTVGGTDMVGALIVGAAAVLIITDQATVALLAVNGFLLGALHALWQPAFRGVMPQIVPRDRLQAANAANGVVANITYVTGSALAGVLVATVGSGWAIMIDAASFLVAGLLVWRLRHLDTPSSGDSVLSPIADLRAGWREFVSRRWMVTTVASLAVFFLAFEAFLGVIAPVQMKAALNGAPDMAVMMAGWGVGGLLGMLLAVRLRPARPMLAAWVLMPTHAVWMLALAVPLAPTLLFAAAVLSGAAMDLTFTFWGTVLQTHVPQDMVSRVASFDSLGIALFGPLGLVLAGPLTDAHGASSTAVMAAAIALTAGLAPLLSRGVRNVERVA
jgi:MFS family permease